MSFCYRSIHLHPFIGSFLTFVFLALPVLSKGAQHPTPYTLESGQSYHSDLAQYLQVLEDSDNTLLIDDIIAGGPQIDFGPLYTIGRLEKGKSYWAKLKVRNTWKNQNTWMFSPGVNDFIEVYLPNEKGEYLPRKCGYLTPASQKDNLSSYQVNLTLPFDSSEVEIIMKIKNEAHANPHLLPILQTPGHYYKNMSSVNLWNFFFQGVLFIVVLYNFALYFFSKDKAYIYFALYLCSISLFYLYLMGYVRGFIFKEYPFYSPYFMIFAPLASLLFYLFFREFFRSYQTFLQWDNVFVHLIRFSILVTTATGILYFITHDISLSSKVIQFVIMVNAVFSFLLVIIVLRSKSPIKPYFVYSTMTLGATALISAISWDTEFSQGTLVQIGLVLQVLILSLGLGKRISLTEKEKNEAQMALIEQLRANRNLMRKRETELEDKVKVRTAEIEKQKNEILRAKDAAEAASKAKMEFLSVMSHEIRTPMNAVIGMTHLLLEEDPKQEQIEYLNTLKFSGENLLILINDILDYNKIESGKIQFEDITFNFDELVKGLGYMFRPRAHTKGIAFQIFVDHDIPKFLIGDPTRLVQVLNNLLGNAVKFTLKGQVTLYISLKKETRDSVLLLFRVEDTGIGIPSDRIATIFEKFSQAESDTTRKFGGSGLGLSISRKILELQGSTIHVESKEKEGSKFYFELKFGIDKKAEETLAPEDKPSLIKLEGVKVLVAEDNVINYKLAMRFLNKWGVDCDVAENGKEALNMIQQKDYDLVFMDLQMPEMDGYQATEAIRALNDNKYKNIPIIALSADVISNVIENVMKSGMNDYLSKPFNPKEFHQKVYQYSRGYSR